MSQSTNSRKSMAALVVAVLVFLVSLAGLGWGFVISVLLAVAAFMGMSMIGRPPSTSGEVMRTEMSSEQPADADREQVVEPVVDPVHQAEEVVVADEVADIIEDRAHSDDEESVPLVKLGTVLPGEAELAERRGTWRYEG